MWDAMTEAQTTLRLLIVDDSPEDRASYRRLINGSGGRLCSFAETDSGEEGLDLCIRLQPDCVLLDYQLPDVDGLEFLSRLFDELKQPLTPVVMLTGQGSESVAVEAMKRGAQDYLVKGSLTRDALQRAIANAVERVAMQLELQQQREELQQFARIAAHDLQEPLRTIGGYCRLLGRRCEGQLDETAQEWITFASDGAERLQNLIQELLVYSEIGSAAMPNDAVSCNSIVDQAIANLQSVIREREAAVTRGELPAARGSSGLMLQLFQNLISNAVKFCDQAPRVRVEGHADNGVCTLSVRDNGIGIKPEHQERVFEIFKRLHSRRQYAGTGIGLAVCRRVVQRHGGRIWVESRMGEGSRFCFTIPNKKSEGSAAP